MNTHDTTRRRCGEQSKLMQEALERFLAARELINREQNALLKDAESALEECAKKKLKKQLSHGEA